jgi:hypothetical protein
MNRTTLALLLTLPLFVVACDSKRSEVAKKLGYEKSSEAQAGPYQLHYGQKGSQEFLLVAKGDQNLLSREGAATDVYLDGMPLIHFERRQDGSLFNLNIDFLDKDGKAMITMIDRDADGQWDRKIDHILGKAFTWEENHWVEESQPNGAANGSQPSRSETNRTSSAAGSRR